MYSVVDLFAGAGGLSLGFLQTGEYDIKAAFEKIPHMQETYHLNHPNVEVHGDVCTADYVEIKRRHGEIDVVIGGPPCQGFSNANRQKNTAVNQNNMLVKQYLRAIQELQPKAFVMENVSMLRSEVHRFFMEENDESIVETCKIPVKDTLIHLLDSEFLFDGVLEIVKDKKCIEKYLWPEEDYFELNVIFKASKNMSKMVKALEKHKEKLKLIAEKHMILGSSEYIPAEGRKAFSSIMLYYSGECPPEDLKTNIEPAIMFQRMLSKALEIFSNNIVVDEYSIEGGLSARIRSFAVFDYLKGILTASPNDYIISSKVLCAADYGAPQKRMRFVIIGIKKSISDTIEFPTGQFNEETYRTVRHAFNDLENVTPVYDLSEDAEGIELQPTENLHELTAELRNSQILRNHIITRTTETALERFRVLKPGENFHALDDSLKTNTYTDASRTQNTIYLRLNYDEPSGTVVNVRKSMWIHPTLDRAISVREAARLQTFPDSFVFCGSKDKQYQQVGNAVPPIMAKSIAKKLAQILTKNLESSDKENG